VIINGVSVSYTGLTPTSLTGCGAHAAYTGGESVHYHGQSPYWCVYALNSGDARQFSFDQAAAQFVIGTNPSAGPITPGENDAIAFTLVAEENPDSKGWLTPGVGWTKSWDGFEAAHSAPFTDADGISYGGESGYKVGVQARILTVATAITGDYTHDSGPTAHNSTLLVAYTLPAAAPASVDELVGAVPI